MQKTAKLNPLTASKRIDSSYRFVLFFAFMVIAVAVFSLANIKSSIMERSFEELTTLHSIIDKQLNTHRQMMFQQISSLATNPDITNTIIKLKNSPNVVEKRQALWQLQQHLFPILYHGQFNDFYIIDVDNTILASSKLTSIGTKLSMPKNFQLAMQHHESSISMPFNFEEESQPIRLLGSSFYSYQQPIDIRLVLKIDPKNNFSRTLYQALQHNQHIRALLVNQNGVIFADSQQQSIHPNSIQKIKIPTGISTEYHNTFETQHQHQNMLMHWEWLTPLDAYLVLETPKTDALTNYFSLRRLIIAILVVVSLIGGLLTLITLNRQRKQDSAKTQELQQLMDSLHEGVVGINEQGQCVFNNQSALNILGFSNNHELHLQPFHQLIHHSYPDGSEFPLEQCPMELARKNQVPAEGRDVFWRKDGEPVHVHYQMRKIEGTRGQHWVMSFEDINEQVKNEQEQEAFRQQIEHTQRLESLGVLAGGIAHDFNNVLAAIMGNTALAEFKVNELANLEVQQALKNYLHKINQSSKHAANLCRQMLAYSGKGRYHIETIDLSEQVKNSIELLQVSIPANAELDLELAENLPNIDVDIAQFQQVIMNLITNAAEALDNKPGKITLRTGTITIEKTCSIDIKNCYGRTCSAGDYCFVEVCDTGCGMDEQTIERIFEPFFTTKFTGRGLGMSAVLGIVNGHHGALKIDSTPGKGSCFRFMLPLSPQRLLQHESSKLPWIDGYILLSEKDINQCNNTVNILESIGFQCYLANDYKQVIDIYQERYKTIRALFIDLKITDKNISDVLQQIRNIHPHARIVFTSSETLTSEQNELASDNHIIFIKKPFTTQTIVEVLEKLLLEDDS